MGRGRGKGKKLAIVARHGDPDSGGEEQLPVYKRRGRPQKHSKDDANEEESEMIEEDGDDFKPNFKEENNNNTVVMETEKKRKRYLQVKENPDTVLEEKDTIIRSKVEESTKTNGFRQNGSRRKSKPHRAAEAGVSVVAVYKGF